MLCPPLRLCSREKRMNTDSERGFLVDLAEHAFKSSQDQVQGRPYCRLWPVSQRQHLQHVPATARSPVHCHCHVYIVLTSDMELGHWVTGSVGHLGHLARPGHRVIILTRCETRVFPVCEKMSKVQNVHLKCWNVTKVIVRFLLLDWNHWMSVHAMNFYFYLWLLKILWPENTSSWHLEFIIEQGHRVNWVSGSLDSRVTGSLGHKMWPRSMSGWHVTLPHSSLTRRQKLVIITDHISVEGNAIGHVRLFVSWSLLCLLIQLTSDPDFLHVYAV